MPDSEDDYELMSRHDVDQLRRELATAKQRTPNPASDMSGISELYNSINRLNSNVTKLITILEDAQQDIVAEYQQSKPAEKLNQILDQNETIAKAILSLNDSITGAQPGQVSSQQMSAPPMSNMDSSLGMPPLDNSEFMPPQQFGQQTQRAPTMQSVMQSPTMSQQQMPVGPSQMSFQNIPPLDSGMPPLNTDMLPEQKKKKFLGLI